MQTISGASGVIANPLFKKGGGKLRKKVIIALFFEFSGIRWLKYARLYIY